MPPKRPRGQQATLQPEPQVARAGGGLGGQKTPRPCVPRRSLIQEPSTPPRRSPPRASQVSPPARQRRALLPISHSAGVLHEEPRLATPPRQRAPEQRPALERQAEKECHIEFTVQPPPGGALFVYPWVPFVYEGTFTISVQQVQQHCGPPWGCDILATWRRGFVGVAGASAMAASEVPNVQLTLIPDGPEGLLLVAAAKGPSNFIRCAKEKWEVLTQAAVGVGTVLALHRPANRAFVLRKPQPQLCRLLVELSAKTACPLLACPTDSNGAVAVLSATNMFAIPQDIGAYLEDRFCIVFGSPSDAIPIAKCPESLLRRLAINSVVAKLHSEGWIAVEHPTRMCRVEVLAKGCTVESQGKSAVHMPSVDILCHRASTNLDGGLHASLELNPAVRAAQPVGLHYARSLQDPGLFGDFELEGTTAVQTPQVHVLPALTAAELTHVWLNGLEEALGPNQPGVCEDLMTREAFIEYWKLIHGFPLPEGALRSFGQAHFFAGSSLTYPLACLWRQRWVHQPMRSIDAGPHIIQAALESMKNVVFFHSPGATSIPFQVVPQQKPSMPITLAVRPPALRTAASQSQHISLENCEVARLPIREASQNFKPQPADLLVKPAAREQDVLGPGADDAQKWKAAAAEAQRKGKRLLLAPSTTKTGAATCEAKRFRQ